MNTYLNKKIYCNLCKSSDLEEIINFGKHPIAHRLLSQKNEEEFQNIVNLIFCKECGLLQLGQPIPKEELYSNYNWLSSWKNNPQTDRLIYLINKEFEIDKNSNIIEIGCNDGSFLKILKNLGYKNLIGIEPSIDGYKSSCRNKINTINSYLTLKNANKIVEDYGHFDFLIARHVIEHITEIDELLKSIKILLKDNALILIEVPNLDFILKSFDYSSIWEEHVNYFNLDILNYFFSRIGGQIIHNETYLFSGETLLVFAKFSEKSNNIKETYLPKLFNDISIFRKRWKSFKQEINKYLRHLKIQNKKIAVYGAGCRACSIINFTGIGKYIDYCFDDQHEKQNKFLPGSHIPIKSGAKLTDLNPDYCLLAVNAENESNVIKIHTDYSNSRKKFVSILPPSKLLPNFFY